MGLNGIKNLLFYEAKPMILKGKDEKPICQYIGLELIFDKTVKDVHTMCTVKGCSTKINDSDVFIPLFCSFGGDGYISSGTITIKFNTNDKVVFGYKMKFLWNNSAQELKEFDLFPIK